MANNYNKQQTNGWRGFAIFLSAILIVGIILGVVFWQRGNIVFTPIGEQQEEQLPDEEQPEDEGKPAIDGDGNEIASDAPVAMPRAMVFRSAAVLDGAEAQYDSVTLEATVYPIDAGNKTVDWSVAWDTEAETPAGAGSWAAEKTVTDYLTITPSSDGSTTATVQCIKPFGCPIIVTVVSRENENATAECKIDFAKRITGLSVEFEEGVTFTDDDLSYTPDSDETTITFSKMDIEYSDYTVNDPFPSFMVSYSGSDEMLTLFYEDDEIGKYVMPMSDCPILGGNNPYPIGLNKNAFNGTFYSFLLTDFDEEQTNAYLNQVFQIVRENIDTPVTEFTVSFEGTYSECSFTWKIYANASALSSMVESIELNQSTVII